MTAGAGDPRGPPRAALSCARYGRLTRAGPEPPCLVGRPRAGPFAAVARAGPRCPPRRSAVLCLGVDRARVPGARAGPCGPMARAGPRPRLTCPPRGPPPAVHAPPVPGARGRCLACPPRGPPAVTRCSPAAIRRRAALGRPPTFHQNAWPIHDNLGGLPFFFLRAWRQLRR